MTTGAEPGERLSITEIEGQLSTVRDRVRSTARGSRRFYWLSWGYLIGTVGAAIASYFISIQLLVQNAGTGASSGNAYPFWGLVLPLIPAFGLLALAIGQLWVGYRGSRTGFTSSPEGRVSASAPVDDMTWTELVQRAQKDLTQARGHAVSGFIPLLLGTLVLCGSSVAYQSSGIAFGVTYAVFVPEVGLVLLLALLPLYLVARRWVARYQSLLDREVGELSRLESEFRSRFTIGVGSG